MIAKTPKWMDPRKINKVTIHCAATPQGKVFTADQISAMDIARADLGNQIAYHYVIELDGNVVKTLRHDQKGAHVGGNNTGNLGICYVGGVLANGKPSDTRTPAQKKAMAILVRKLLGDYPGSDVKGHRDWPGVAKACPCFDVKVWLKAEGIVK